jgi:hypothetical protein
MEYRMDYWILKLHFLQITAFSGQGLKNITLTLTQQQK